MLAAAHADERSRHAGRRADELERARGSGLEARQGLGDRPGQPPRELSLEDRGARDRHHAEPASGLERAHALAVDQLRRSPVRLGHGEVVGQLDHLEVMPRARDRFRLAHELGERQVIARLGRLAEAVPRGDAVAADAPCGDLLLEQLEGGADAAQELRARHGGELTLGVVDVVDVDRLEPEVREAPPELVLQVARRHGVSADHVLGAEDPGADVGVAHVGRGVGRDAAVERDVPALRAHHDLLAWEAALPGEGGERLAEHPLAALRAVVDRGVEEVAAEVGRVDDRRAGPPVGLVVLLAEVGAEADRGDEEAVERAEVARRDLPHEDLAVGCRAGGGRARAAAHAGSAPSVRRIG